MTCIAGIAHRGRCYLLADTAVSDGEGLSDSALPKVRRVGGFVYGASGDCRACDVAVRWALPKWDGAEPRVWVVDVLAPVVRQRLRDCGERGATLELLLGVGGVLLSLDSDLAVTVWPDGYGAVGSGAQVALGALYATRSWPGHVPRLKVAIRAAERHCGASVRGMGRVVSA